MSMKYVLKSLSNIKIVRPSIEGSGAIYRTQVTANFSPVEFSRRTIEKIEKQINEMWETKCGYNQRLYNGSKFRLAGWSVSDGKCVINVGLTNYKDLCGTNLAPNLHEIMEMGRKDLNEPQAYMSDAIGVGILLLTSDGCLLVTRRAPWTGEYPSMLDRPGGHPEPENVFTPTGKLRPEFESRGDVHGVVMDEIWNAACQETEDEIGLTKDQVQDVRFLGLSFNLDSGGRPSLEFFARLTMKGEEVKTVYCLGRQKEADESTALHLIPPPVSALMPKLLLAQTNEASNSDEEQVRKKARRDDHDAGDDEDKDDSKNISEAKSLLEEATPFLKAGLVLAHEHKLL